MSRIRLPARRRLCVGLLAFLPSFGADEAANRAVEEGNSLYGAGHYAAALEKYAAAAALVPQSAEITFNQGNVWFQQHDYDKALEHYMAALTTEDVQLKSRIKYNIGVIRLRQALATEQSLTEAMALTRVAIQSFREGLELDRTHSDGRYNLELALRFWSQLERRRLERQRNELAAGDRTSLRRGQALQDLIRNEGVGDRRAQSDNNRQPYGERGNQVPENFSSNEQQQRPTDAQLPVAMSPEGAAQLMERLLQEMRAAEAWRQEKRRTQPQAAGEREPW